MIKKMLLKKMEGYLENSSTNFRKDFFAEDIKICVWNWVINPFESIPIGLQLQEEEQLIDPSNNEEKRKFAVKFLSNVCLVTFLLLKQKCLGYCYLFLLLTLVKLAFLLWLSLFIGFQHLGYSPIPHVREVELSCSKQSSTSLYFNPLPDVHEYSRPRQDQNPGHAVSETMTITARPPSQPVTLVV